MNLLLTHKSDFTQPAAHEVGSFFLSESGLKKSNLR